MKAILGAAVIAAALVSWQPNAHATEGQLLTRADCDKAGLAWDGNGNVCGTQSEAPKAQLFSEPAPDITGAITSGQPLTRADCDKVGMAWNDRANVCGLEETATQSSASSESASKPHGTTKRSTKMNGHAQRTYAYRSAQQTRTVGRLFSRFFGN